MPPRPGAAAAPLPPAPSSRVTLVAWSAALLWAAVLPALIEHALPRRAGAPGAAAALLGSPVPHTLAAAAFLIIMLLRQGRWHRPWQSALLIALCALYLAGCAALMAVAQGGGGAPAR
jgi:hypothetical protein